jgi:signal transduction histidine kinase
VSTLAQLLERNRENLAQRFADRASTEVASRALDREQLIDSLRDFIDEIARAVGGEGGSGDGTAVRQSAAATDHGKQRLGIGYDISGLIREYDSLQDEILGLVETSGYQPSIQEMRVLTRQLVGGIVDAASRYATEKDEELRRQTARHVAFLAHELRNPVGSMKLAFDTLRRGVTPDESTQLVAIVERCFRKLTRMIDDVLVGARFRTTAEARLQLIPLATTVRELARESQVDAETRGIKLLVETPADEVLLSADPRLFASAVSNLIRNAVKFSREGGTIHVRARQVEERVLIEVQDECGGLEDGQLDKLFDPFVQVGADRSGFGLGLAIAKQVVDAHKGAIRVHNLPGSGCVFVIELPIAPALPLSG